MSGRLSDLQRSNAPIKLSSFDSEGSAYDNTGNAEAVLLRAGRAGASELLECEYKWEIELGESSPPEFPTDAVRIGEDDTRKS